MTKIAIAYHSGFGHTDVVAHKIAEGITAAGGTPSLHNVATLDDALWHALAGADAIVFGSPTYMGSVSAPFKAFMDASSKPWFSQVWKDKLAAGFTNSGGLNGDKANTLNTLMVFAAQHSMLWLSLGQVNQPGLNRLGAYSGLMTQATNTPAGADNPPADDQASAVEFGKRIAAATAQWVKGR